jgi:hypothetical protein
VSLESDESRFQVVLTIRRSNGSETQSIIEPAIRGRVQDGCFICSHLRPDGSEEHFIFPLANLIEVSMIEIK